jgi:hypothetical protein
VIDLNTKAPTATLDSSVMLEYWKSQARVMTVARLLEYAAAGLVDLAVTRHIEQDIPDLPLAAEIAKLPELGVARAPGVAVLGSWNLGSDALGDPTFVKIEAAVVAGWGTHMGKLPDARDRWHLHAHYVLSRDLFVTWDKRLLNLAAAFTARGIPIEACKPEALAAGLRLRIEQRRGHTRSRCTARAWRL